MALQHQLTYYRQKMGLSQRELATRAGVSPGAVCLYEQGRRSPSLGVLFRLATALEVSVSELTKDVVGTEVNEKWN